MLLTFSRSNGDLQQALLRTSQAEVARQQGLDVQPAWGCGAKIFV